MLGQEPDMREQQRQRRRPLAGDTPGHPARGRTVIAAGLLAHGSMPVSGLPEAFASVASMDKAHRLQLRGQLRSCAIHLDRAHRIPSWLRITDPQNRDAQVMGSGLSPVKGKASHCRCAGRAREVSGQARNEIRLRRFAESHPMHEALRSDCSSHQKKISRDLLSISRVCHFGPVIHIHRCLTASPERYQM